MHGAHAGAGLGQVDIAHALGDAEVDHLGVAVAVDQDVLVA